MIKSLLNKAENSFVIDGYKKNPLRYRYEEVDCPEDIKSMVSDISETPLQGADGKNYYEVIFSKSIPEKYYLSEYDKEMCLASLLDFDKWFYFCKESDSILCDSTELIKDIIEKYDTTVREAMLMRPTIGIWWKGRKLKWDRLKYVYGSLSSKNDSLEGMLTKLEIRKAVCRHPIEWDKNQFSKLKENILGKPVKTRLENEASEIDLWNGGLDKIFSNSPYFYHPIYFINHLDKAGLFEFNPYAGKKYKDVYGFEGNAPGINMDAVITGNPGFAPVWIKGSWDDPNPNTNGYACVTGFFNQDYLNVRTGSGETYKEKGFSAFTHEGVDFRGSVGTKIKSFIYGNVLAYGTFGSYGRAVFIANRDKTGIFLLGHLSGYNADVLDKKAISPGDVVGYVGTSGPSDENGIDGKYDAHLHITFFKISDPEFTKTFINGTNGQSITTGDSYNYGTVYNPFDYASKKKPNIKQRP